MDWLPSAADGWNDWEGIGEADRGEPVTRAYDVAKALQRITDDEGSIDDARTCLKWQVVGLLGGYEPDRAPGLGIDVPSAAKVKSGYEVKVAVDGATLTVEAPLGTQTEIQRNLRAWEQGGLRQICIATRFMTDERDIASALGISWRYLEARADDRDEPLSSEGESGATVVRAKAAVCEYLPITVANLKAEQTTQLMKAVQENKRANVVQAPKLTLINGQRAAVFDRTQTPFVIGLENVGKGLQRPKIEVIDEGIRLTLRATQNSDATKIQLEGCVELSEIDEVRTATALLGDEPRTIQLPRVKHCNIAVCSEVPDGESLLIGCIPSYDQKRFFYVLLTVRCLGSLGKAVD